MGIPKFYRWLSERYPCLSEVVKEHQIPEFDNFYLDMNGIIHNCSHPDDSVYIQMSESKIFADICHYIEVLFGMIKPRKVFFMAVDGVAPRAKMNQQRSRRFRSAKEAENVMKKEMKKTGVAPTGTLFDSNCITPGTEFMARLNTVLKEFVATKVKSDALWQRPYIIFSGHEAPGEGEHKIMDFIRREKSREGFDPNTRHCLYGLDADLIMLSLVTHEPHLSLLREEIKFNRKEAKKAKVILPEEITFHLLHISLLRDYLGLEFGSIKEESLSFEYDLERIIDDWVLMGFLVGNDFIPNLPNFHIHHDCLPVLWGAYKRALPSLGGYINEGGLLNLPRFERYLNELHQFDLEKFEELYTDAKWLKNKRRGGRPPGDRGPGKSTSVRRPNHNRVQPKEDDERSDEDDDDVDDENGVENDVIKSYSLNSSEAGIPSASEFMERSSSDAVEDERSAEASAVELQQTTQLNGGTTLYNNELMEEFKKFKTNYYIEKFNRPAIDETFLRSLVREYVEAIQWILHYYYNGIQSWSWFYPRHYAPFLTDVLNFSNLQLTYDMARPFLPFQQLMAVLPRASNQLLPSAYRKLMDRGSELEEYYPENFLTDLNGKMQDWEAVVLIPFINEKVLLAAMESPTKTLTKEEKDRNKFGPHVIFCFNDKNLDVFSPDGHPVKHDGTLLRCELPSNHFVLRPNDIYKGLCEGVNLRSLFYGFPTLRHVAHRGELRSCGVQVFNRSSSNPSMVLVLPATDDTKLEEVGRSLVGRVRLLNWPLLVEALVVSVSTEHQTFRSDKRKHEMQSVQNLELDEDLSWHREAQILKERYMSRYGVDVRDTKILVGAKRFVGKKFVVRTSGEVSLEKQWSETIEYFLHQTSVEYSEKKESEVEHTLTSFFDLKSSVFMLANPQYGCEGKVLDVSTDKPRITAKFSVPTEPDLENLRLEAMESEGRYLPSYLIAQKLSMSSHLLSRITGTIFVVDEVDSKKLNVGLNLKYTKQNMEVPGYSKKTEKEWLFSRRVIDIMRKYMETFTELFEGIAVMSSNDLFSARQIFKENRATRLAELESFLKSLPTYGLEPRRHGTTLADCDVIKNVEREVDAVKKSRRQSNVMKIKPHLLFVPKLVDAPCHPDESAAYELLDRVVNVRAGSAIPLGLRGTVVGIEPGEKSQGSVFDVLFDREFPGAISLRCSGMKCYRVSGTSLINISHGERMSTMRNKKPSRVGWNLAAKNKNSHHVPPQRLVVNGNDDKRDESHSTSDVKDEQSDQEAFSRIWNQLKNANSNRSGDRTSDPTQKIPLQPVPPNLKPPQAWIDKTSRLQNSNQAKKITVDELMKGAECLMKNMVLNGSHGNRIAPTTVLPHHQLPPVGQQHHACLQQQQHLQERGHLQNRHHHPQLQQQPPKRQQHLNHEPQRQPFNPQQLFVNRNHHQHHQQISVPQNPMKEKLFVFCRTNGLGHPNVEVRSVDGGHQGRVHIMGKGWFVGPMCRSEVEAVEESARLALRWQEGCCTEPSSAAATGTPVPPLSDLVSPKQPDGPQASAPTSLNPNANVFIPTQVLLRQKSKKVACPPSASKAVQESPKKEQVAVKDAKGETTRESAPKENPAPTKKRVARKKRIAANFTCKTVG